MPGMVPARLSVCLSCRRVVNERETMGVTEILADYSGFAAGKEGRKDERTEEGGGTIVRVRVHAGDGAGERARA